MDPATHFNELCRTFHGPLVTYDTRSVYPALIYLLLVDQPIAPIDSKTNMYMQHSQLVEMTTHPTNVER